MPKKSLTLPEDVITILQSVNTNLSEAICHLARSYDAIMEEQGQESQPVILPTPVEDAEEPSMPTAAEVESLMTNLSQPRGSLDEVRLRVHDKSLPRDVDGLVKADYILASGVPIVEELLHNGEYTEEEYTLRFTAIREVLSATPEDLWATGLQIPLQVGIRQQELTKGRRPIGKKI